MDVSSILLEPKERDEYLWCVKNASSALIALNSHQIRNKLNLGCKVFYFATSSAGLELKVLQHLLDAEETLIVLGEI